MTRWLSSWEYTDNSLLGTIIRHTKRSHKDNFTKGSQCQKAICYYSAHVIREKKEEEEEERERGKTSRRTHCQYTKGCVSHTATHRLLAK